MIPRRGVAHYLEHKMFEMPDRDVMQEFSALGANPNAFTSYNMTAYYFTCTEHFEACLELLLTFVSTPYFTEESVERERGIIAQEIRMYEDSADSQVYEDLFAAMYRHHPVRVPIAGTVESIEAITPEILRSCYDAFYHPANMMLCVVGDVDPAQVVAAAGGFCLRSAALFRCGTTGRRRSRGAAPPVPAGRWMWPCPPSRWASSAPWPGFGPAGARQELVGDLAAEALMGESSRLYLELYQAGLIDSSFAAGYEDMPGWPSSAVAETAGIRGRPGRHLRRGAPVGCRGVEEELFHRLKRSALGRRVRALDSFDSTCFRLCQAHFSGTDFWTFPAEYDAVTKEEVEAFLRQTVREDLCAISVVLPRQQRGMTMLTYTEISFPGLGISLNPSTGITLGSFSIRWYGLVIALGLCLAVLYACRRSRQFGFREDDVIDGVLWVTPFAILCARAYYCAFSWEQYAANPISCLYIWEGGLAIYGGVIGAVLGCLVYCRVKKLNVFALLDLVCLGFLIGQCIGRWGNFFNREAFGEETSSFLRMGLYNPVTGQTSYVHPTFLYESLWNLVGFLLLHFLSKGRKYDGQTALQYMAWYGAGRAVIEGLRTDSLYIPGTSLRVSQILAAVGCVVALVILAVQAVRKHDPSGLFVNRVAAGQAPEAPSEEQPGKCRLRRKKSLKDRFQTWLRT